MGAARLPAILLQSAAEEIAFRGYLMQGLAARFRSPLAWWVLPAVLFGILHWNPVEFGADAWLAALAATVIGLVLGHVTACTGNLSVAMGLHFANNAFAMLVLAVPSPVAAFSLWLAGVGAGAEDATLRRGLLLLDLATTLVAYAAWLWFAPAAAIAFAGPRFYLVGLTLPCEPERMNWISNYVRPKINSLFSRREVPENLWVKCDNCGTMLFHRELADNLNVCTNCGHHLAISPRDRFAALFDGGVFVEIPVPKPLADPLGFKDQKKYPDRLREARSKTGEEEAMLVAEGEIGRLKVVCVGQDFAFMAGSMGMYVGNAIVAAAERAVKRKCPLVLFAAAGGARMQEGILSLMQMPRSTVAVQMLKEAGLPYIVVLTNPTTGGVTASYAMLGDVQIAEPGALICFAGPRVIEQTIRETLPEGFQRAEYLLDHGMLDRVVARKDLRDELATLLRLLPTSRPMSTATCRAPVEEDAGRRAMTATSDRVLDRLTSLHPKVIDLTLGRVERLLAALGHPERRLPPVIHVAGTNGKGSVVAMLRAGLESAGLAVHAYTSPHLARFHERIRIAGELIAEDRLIAELERCEAANAGAPITFFEITTAAAFLAMAETPADFALLEVGLGGRLDATNVIARPRLTAITAGLDRPPAVPRRDAARDRRREGRHPEAGRGLHRRRAAARGARGDRGAGRARSGPRSSSPTTTGRSGRSMAGWPILDAAGLLDLPLPNLIGAHQVANAGIALAALRALGLDEPACAAAVGRAEWPARLQRLRHGPLVEAAGPCELWLDGGHNPAAGAALAEAIGRLPARPVHLVTGMLRTKDAAGFLRPLAAAGRSLRGVSIPGETATLTAEETVAAARAAGFVEAEPAADVRSAVAAIAAADPGCRILICGSLYLAGSVLRENS